MSETLPDRHDAVEVAVHRESALTHRMVATRRDAGHDVGVIIREEAFKGQLNLRGDPDSEIFRSGVAEALGVELPVVPGTFNTNGDTRVYWLGPTEWLMTVTGGLETEVQGRLRQTLSGHFAVVDVSGGQTIINLSGEAVHMVLKKSSVYDFHSSHFQVGRCAQTTFAKATALISKTGDNAFTLVIRRSFADYIFRWIIDAADEYGVEVKTEGQ
ncbi:MAG: sarcosine oxidase subunit gamma [Halieaceae bacterium]|jgi:sarcosine oxidase subunit gamma